LIIEAAVRGEPAAQSEELVEINKRLARIEAALSTVAPPPGHASAG
jgi:hypothetical protein